MKKIVIFISLLLTVGITVLVVYFISTPKVIEQYYSLTENMCYVNDEESFMEINIYSTIKDSIIKYPNLNIYTLDYDKGSTILNVSEVEESMVDKYYIYTIKSNLPNPYDEFKNKKVSLKINNEKFNLSTDIGYLTICDVSDYKLLSVKRLYGSFSYINGELLLTGLNIVLNGNYNKISSVKVGPSIYGDLENVLFNEEMKSVIDINKIIPNYKFYHSANTHSAVLKSNMIFIPLQYEKVVLTTNSYVLLIIDDKKYYLDNFSYYSQVINIDNYKSMKKEGVILYA